MTYIAVPFCFTMQNFNEIGQPAAELWPKYRLSIWWPSAIFNLKIFIFGHVADVLFMCVKFIQNRMIFREDMAF